MQLRLLPPSRVVIVWSVFNLLLLTKLAYGWAPFGKKAALTVEGPKNATSHHPRFMELALKQAKKAGRKGEVPIGAVVVGRTENGEYKVLSKACNNVETKFDASAHAELLALRKAATKTKNWRLSNTTLFTTLEPCPMCLAAAQAFRVSSIVYGAPDLRLGAIKTHIQLLDVDHPYHTIEEVISDVCAEESAAMLRSFFRARRKQSSDAMKGNSRLAILVRFFSSIRNLG